MFNSQREQMKMSVPLLTGDLVCFLIFAALGLHSHREALTAANFGRAFVPFAGSWLLFALAFGLTGTDEGRQPSRIGRRIGLVWVPAWSLGLVARSLVFGRPLIFAFALVSLLFPGVLLVGWRTGFGLLFDRSRSPAQTPGPTLQGVAIIQPRERQP